MLKDKKKIPRGQSKPLSKESPDKNNGKRKSTKIKKTIVYKITYDVKKTVLSKQYMLNFIS